MKKLFLLITIMSFVLSGCSLFSNEAENFEEVQKVDIEISDFVEGSQESETPEVSNELSTEVQENNENTSIVDNTKDDITPDTPQYVEKSEVVKQELNNVNQENSTITETNKPSTPQTEQSTNVVETESKTINTDLTGKIICIDAAHGIFEQNIDENIAPETEIKKPGNKEGTKGQTYIEDDITLSVANKLKTLLESNNATVIMTRTNELSTMTNKERALYANENNADIVIKLHADGTKEGGKGMTVLVPSDTYVKDEVVLEKSKKLAKLILSNSTKETKAKNRGLYYTSQLSGFNWSKVPVVLFEMGFITNPDEEILLADSQYQDKIAKGIQNAIIEYYNN